MSIKVSLVEDNDRVRESLATLIGGARGFSIAGTHRTAEQALKAIPSEEPDVVLMDIHLPKWSGIECVRRLKVLRPRQLVVMLTAYDDDDLIFQALKAGASGYLLKQLPPAELLVAIQEAHSGGAPMASSIARRVIESFHSKVKPAPPGEGLSPREREILGLIAKGFTNKEIADSLGVTFLTVQSHVRNILQKLHASSRSEAVAKYLGS